MGASYCPKHMEYTWRRTPRHIPKIMSVGSSAVAGEVETNESKEGRKEGKLGNI